MFNPNMANMDPNLLKQQSEMFKNMSDAEIQARINQARSFMPGMPNISPEMMKFASQQMAGMSPDQIE